MELKQIEIKNIFANLSQPRETFDKEKIKELAESILSNGLINPISVRIDPKIKGKYMIIAGERRTRACKVAGLKKIQAFVKTYKNDIDWQIESLVENLQREDLTSTERENNVYVLWETGEFKTQREFAKRLGLHEGTISAIISSKEFRDKKTLGPKVSTSVINDTSGLNEEDRVKVIKFSEKKEIGGRTLRELSKVIKKAPEEVKDALLSDKITREQAERISKLKTESQRNKAIQDHKNISMIEKGVERNVEHQVSAKEKREFDKRLIQAGSWVTSFRGSVTETNSEIEKTFKILLLATKFLNAMDEKQKERLEIDLDRFIERLEKGLQLAEQIQEKI